MERSRKQVPTDKSMYREPVVQCCGSWYKQNCGREQRMYDGELLRVIVFCYIHDGPKS